MNEHLPGVGVHLEQFEPEHLGVGDERIGPAVPDVDRLVDELVGLDGLLGDGADGVLEDLSLAARHGEMLGGCHDASGRENAELAHGRR